MGTYFTDFSEYTTDAQPSDWTKRWHTTMTAVVRADAGATGGKVLELDVSSNNRCIVTWDEIDGDANRDEIEVLFRGRSSAASGDGPAAIVRGSGDDTSETAYRGGIAFVGEDGQDRVVKFVNATFGALANNVDDWSADTFYWMRFQVHSTALKFRRWAGAIGDEPVAWDIETTDSDISAAGWVGFFAFGDGEILELDLIGVGTNGDAAPSASDGDPGGSLLHGKLLRGGLLMGKRLV